VSTWVAFLIAVFLVLGLRDRTSGSTAVTIVVLTALSTLVVYLGWMSSAG
jgi:hypothetical protein